MTQTRIKSQSSVVSSLFALRLPGDAKQLPEDFRTGKDSVAFNENITILL